MAVEFPAFLKLEYQADGSARSTLLAEIEGALQPAERRFAEFSAEANKQLDAALSVRRNQSGSLDLGVDELRNAAKASEARAIAAREVAAATRIAAREEGDYGQAARLSVAATEALAREETEAAAAARSRAQAAEQVQQVLNRQKSATDALVASTSRGTNAQGNVINSTRASRVAFIQLGQQMQDVTIQAQLGTNAFQIFAQQVPQAAFALSGLESSTNKTQAAVGKFATFMSGPWGAAIFAATAVLGPFIYRMFEAEEATKAAEFASYQFSDAQNVLGGVIDLTTGKINTQSQALLALARAQAIAGQIEARREQAAARAEFGDIETFRARIDGGFGGGLRLSRERSNAADITEAFREGSLSLAEAERGLESLLDTGMLTEEQYLRAAQAIVQFGVAAENIKVFEDAQAALNGDRDALQQFLNLPKPKKERGGKSSDAEDRRAIRAAEQLAEFGERAAERISRINERFDEQPRLIDQAAQATRELDDLIKDLSERKPIGFEDLVEDAEEAKFTIEDALLRPFEELEQASQRHLQIERLILAGREDEAAVLETIWQIESRRGPLTEAEAGWVEDVVRAREEELEVMERLFEQQSAYLDATRELRGELESFFSGEGADFERIARRLQARLTVERLFGDALRDIEDTVKSGFDKNVDYLARETDRASLEVGEFADAMSSATARINNPALGAVAPIPAAANDDEIVVTADQDAGSVGGMTSEAYFELVGKKLVDPLLAGLEEQIGVKLAGQLSDLLGGAAGGFLAAGPVGAGLGFLKNLPGLSEGLQSLIGGALEGATKGAQADALLDSLGLNSSKTGATIGGALGSVFGPVGQLVGSIAGGLIGGILKGSQRGGVTIGGVGDELGVVSSFGKSKFQDFGRGASGGIIDQIAQIADALGVTLDASRGSVSIGQRKGSIRIDPTGRGNTKTSRGAIDFGEDEQAAIAFAIRDLINDGVIAGLSAAEDRLLRAGKDINAAIQDVLDFRSVADRLRQIKDPLGFALDELSDEFDDLRKLFERAGASTAEYAELEELYGLERARVIEEAGERTIGALKDLLDDLNFGDSGLSLRERRSNAEAEYDVLAERVRAGDTSAFDDFAEAARELLAIEREIFGSQAEYFDRFDEVRDLSQSAVDAQQRAIDEATNRDTPFGGPGDAPLINAIDRGNNQVVEQLIALNDNFSRLGSMMMTSGNMGFGRSQPYQAFSNSF